MRLLGLLMSLGILYLALNQSSILPSQVPSAISQSGSNPAAMMHLRLAVQMTAQNAECGYTSVGYGHNTPAEAAAELVHTMNASMQAMPGEPSAPGPELSYRLDRPDKPWQIIVSVDEARKRLRIEGYATDLTQPIATQSIPCG